MVVGYILAESVAQAGKLEKCGFTSQLIQTVAVLSLSPFYLNYKVRVTLSNNAYHIGWLSQECARMR